MYMYTAVSDCDRKLQNSLPGARQIYIPVAVRGENKTPYFERPIDHFLLCLEKYYIFKGVNSGYIF